MSTTHQQPSIPTRSESAELRQGQSWDERPVGRGNRSRLISVIAPAPDLTPADFLRGAHGIERFYWSEPGGDGLTIAATGVAAEIRVPPILDPAGLTDPFPDYRFDEVENGARLLFSDAIVRCSDPIGGQDGTVSALDHPARPRLFGGFAFQDDFVPDNTWSVFSPAHFVLPHFQATRLGGETYLTANALVSPDEDITESLSGLREALLARLTSIAPSAPGPIGRPELRYPMSYDSWRRIIRRATAAIDNGRLEKVVLSRVCEVKTGSPIDAAIVLDFLDSQYNDSYRFLFEPIPHHAFFGATPELLIRKDGDRLWTMALAGSIGRGRTPQQDDELAGQLLASVKDHHEHALVVDAIRDKLEESTVELTVRSEPTILRLRNIQHLLTPIEGRLHEPAMSIISLVRVLHPTPAMGGVPANRALAFLREAEPVPRGWYAAPIGWLDANGDGVFAVAIRSAVTQHGRAWLYAGAGIVGDSDPEREWAETALKFRPMLGALGVAEAV
jgi:menaquinone-specific isochorismate synthase